MVRSVRRRGGRNCSSFRCAHALHRKQWRAAHILRAVHAQSHTRCAAPRASGTLCASRARAAGRENNGQGRKAVGRTVGCRRSSRPRSAAAAAAATATARSAAVASAVLSLLLLALPWPLPNRPLRALSLLDSRSFVRSCRPLVPLPNLPSDIDVVVGKFWPTTPSGAIIYSRTFQHISVWAEKRIARLPYRLPATKSTAAPSAAAAALAHGEGTPKEPQQQTTAAKTKTRK